MPSASWAQFSRALLALGRKKAAAASAPSSVPVSALKLAEAVKAIGKDFQMTLSYAGREGPWAVFLDKL